VLHSDLKSKNVLLTKELTTAKIGDVGLARIIGTGSTSVLDGSCEARGVGGTFAYAAPEMLLNQRCDLAADVYSFGVVLWEFVCQEIPIRGHLRDVKVPDECPANIAHLIESCLEV
jgi:serine/threonine protein kinase